jgi:predicted Zn-dependent protease
MAIARQAPFRAILPTDASNGEVVAVRRILAFWLALVMAAIGMIPPVGAQVPRLALVRDAEIEGDIRAMMAPVFRAAGLSPDAVGIYLVDSPQINAFVAGGPNIFVYTGLIVAARNAGELVGVIAHETGHIAGGHLVRGAEEARRLQEIATIGILLGAAAGAAAGSGGLAAAGIAGSVGIGQRGIVTFTRGLESSADQAALRFLRQAGLSADGFLSLLEYTADQEVVPSGRQSEYTRTHPLSTDRVDAVRAGVDSSPYRGVPLPKAYDARFAMIRAKLFGFTQPQAVAGRYPPSDTTLPAQYARAIAAYRRGVLADAMTRTRALVEAAPDNPYFQEFMGQILLESGRVAEARPFYERAVALAPAEPLLLVPLAQTKIEGGDPADLPGAIRDLTRATGDRDRPPSMAWRLLAIAYGRQGDLGQAAVALAEEALLRGDVPGAALQATRALDLLPRGSPGWLRAQDIEREAERRRG